MNQLFSSYIRNILKRIIKKELILELFKVLVK